MVLQGIWWQYEVELQPFSSEQVRVQVFSEGCSQWRPVRFPEQVTAKALRQDQGLEWVTPQMRMGSSQSLGAPDA